MYSLVDLSEDLTRAERVERMLDDEQAVIELFDRKQLYNFEVSRLGNTRLYDPGKSGP